MNIRIRMIGLRVLLLVCILAAALPCRLRAQAGSVDTSFNPSADNTSHNAFITGTGFLVQGDGSMVVNGFFNTINGVAYQGLARLYADGSLDTGFHVDTGPGGGSGALDVVVQPTDGKLLVGGLFNQLTTTAYGTQTYDHIARLYPNGVPDTTFTASANNSVAPIAVQTDGKIVIGGYFTQVNGTACNYIARLNADGSLDTGFNPGNGANSYVYAVAVQPDGKIVIGGVFTEVNGTACGGITRLNTDGSLDPSFVANLAVTSTADAPGVDRLTVQADGKILISGVFNSINGVARNCIARLNTDGSVDAGFNPGTGANEAVVPVALQADGKVIIGGNFTQVNGTTFNYIARLNADGSVDQTFDPGTGTNSPVYSAVLQSDGRILIGGGFSQVDGMAHLSIARLNGDPPAITSATAASAQVGQAFSYQITASFSPTGYKASGLPPGLGVNSAGLISGTPTTTGSYPVTISAANASGTGAATLTITVAPPAPVISSGTPPNGQVGTPYGFQLTATNNPTSFGQSGLPPGLNFNTGTGLISGTPTQAGTFNVTFSATNGGGTGSASYTLTILPAAPVIESVLSASGQVGQPFTYQIVATNSPTNYNVQSGSILPPGLMLNTTSGLISGTPTLAGTFTVMLTANNDGGLAMGTGTATLTLSFTDTPSLAPTITGSTSVAATEGEFVSFALTATNAPTSYGEVGLPPGLTLDATNGLISGTPIQAGTYTASISAVNASGTGTAALTITVAVPPANIQAVHILSPPSNINIVIGETIDLDVAVAAVNGTLANVDYAVYDATDTTLVTHLGDTAAPRYEFAWMPTALGDFTLQVTASDTAKNVVPSTILIHVKPSPAAAPNSDLLAALDGKYFAAGTTLPLLGMATDASGNALTNTQFYADGAQLDTTPASASTASSASSAVVHRQDAAASPFSKTEFAMGNLIKDALLTLVATDGNQVSKVSNHATIHITAAPSNSRTLACAVVSPTSSSQIMANTATTATVTASETGGSIGPVELFVDLKSVGVAPAAPYNFTIPASAVAAAGPHALTAIATDANNISAASEAVIVNAVGQTSSPTPTPTPAPTPTPTPTPTPAPPVVTVTASASVEEGAKGKIVFQRTGDTSSALTVRYKVAGDAQAGTDYKTLPGTVLIPAGQTQAKVKLKTIDNPTVDGTRVLKIKLRPATDGSYTLGGQTTVKIKITDDD